MIPRLVEARAGLDRIAGVVTFVFELPLAELRTGYVPGKFRQPDFGLGIAIGAAVVAMDIGTNLETQIRFGRVCRCSAGAEHLGDSHHALVEARVW